MRKTTIRSKKIIACANRCAFTINQRV